MIKTDKATTHYAAGLGVLSFLQICMTHGLFDKRNQLRGSELYMDGTDFSQWTDLAADAANSLAGLIGSVIIFIVCAVLSAFVMLLLRSILKAPFDPQTKKRGLFCAAASMIVCFLFGCLFSRLHDVVTVLILSLPVPAVSWLIFHAGREPEQPKN